VALLERGAHPGSKNMFGGVLYTHSLRDLLPDFAYEAPLERAITRRVIAVTAGQATVAIDFGERELSEPPYCAFTVIRSHFDRWFAERARAAGATLLCRTVADRLKQNRSGVVEGVVLRDGNELVAPLTICADGVNSLLARRAGLRLAFTGHELALGVKKTLALPAKVIEERFRVEPGEGVDTLYMGGFTQGMTGGGFLYTNRETVSAGITVTLAHLRECGMRPEQLLDLFLAEPSVRKLVAGAEMLEYSAHLVPEGGYRSIPALFASGVLLAGDAAGFVLNSGLNLEGANLAITSGRLAAETALAAHGSGDFTGAHLSRYRKGLEDSHVLRDLKTYRAAPDFLDNSRVFTAYPSLLTGILHELLIGSGASKRRIHRVALGRMGQIGWRGLLRDAWAARRYI
jgi:electron transfer flavoprotein-quinone oxidoreductase